MADKWQAIQQFWEGFGLPAYDESYVPDDTPVKYITYMVYTDSLDNPVSLNASIWDESKSWEFVSKKADEIAEYIVNMYPPSIKLDEGRLYLAKGSPFAQRIADEDERIKRIYLSVEAEFLTAN